MTKKLFIVFTTLILLFSTLVTVSAEENDNEQKALVDINVVIDTPYPEDFFNDIVLYLTKDGVTTERTVYNVNNYKDNFQIESGTYSLRAKIIGDLAEFYYISQIPNEITLTNSTINLAQPITIVVSDNTQMFEDVTLEIDDEPIVDSITKEETTNNEIIKNEHNTNIDTLEETPKENKLVTIVIEGVITAGILIIAYVVFKKKFDN